MKHTLGTSEAISALLGDKNASWTYDGATALVEWLEQLEQETGYDAEFDVVAIRCEFSEYASVLEAVREYVAPTDMEQFVAAGDYCEDTMLDYLRDHTSVFEFDGGLIVQDF